MGNGDERFVTWGRWEAEHRALREWAQDQFTAVRDDIAEIRHAGDEHRGRVWTLSLAFLTGLILPLTVVAILAVISAHGR